MTPSTVTGLEREPGHSSRYRVYIDHRYAFSVHEDIVVRHRIRTGLSLDETAVREIVRDEERHRALRESLKFIGTRPRTAREVERKLKADGYEPEVVGEVLRRLTSLRYVDDEDYARNLAGYRLNAQKKGKQWIANELKSKGVDRRIIEHTLSAVSEDDERRAAYELAVRKWRREQAKGADKTARKIGAYLLRRGFSPSIVQGIVRELSEQAGMNDRNELCDWADE